MIIFFTVKSESLLRNYMSFRAVECNKYGTSWMESFYLSEPIIYKMYIILFLHIIVINYLLCFIVKLSMVT